MYNKKRGKTKRKLSDRWESVQNLCRTLVILTKKLSLQYTKKGYWQYYVLLDKNFTCEVKQKILKIRTFCFKV